MRKNEIYRSYGTDYKEMTKRLLERSDLRSLLPDISSRIAIKPNLATPTPADFGGTTHPEVVAGIIEYLQELGCENIVIAEGSWVGDVTSDAFDYCGYYALRDKYHVELIDTQKEPGVPVACGEESVSVCACVRDWDFLINVPVLKGHCQTNITCALKNMKGLIPNEEKRRFHRDGLHRPIALLNSVIRQDFIVIDHICGDLNFEEGGNPVHTNRMYLGTDPVQIDAYGCRLMGLRTEDVPYIQLAEKWGAGRSEIQEGDIVTLNAPEESRTYPAPSGIVNRLTRQVKADSACSACYASLVRGLYMAQEEGIRVRTEIAIGQGYRRKSLKGLGIGNCCAGADFCARGCPPTASDVLKLLRESTEH